MGGGGCRDDPVFEFGSINGWRMKKSITVVILAHIDKKGGTKIIRCNGISVLAEVIQSFFNFIHDSHEIFLPIFSFNMFH